MGAICEPFRVGMLDMIDTLNIPRDDHDHACLEQSVGWAIATIVHMIH